MEEILIRRAVYLSWFTVAYNLIEGIVSIGFGAEDSSISLLGFGIDSLIEVASALAVLWRFRAETMLNKEVSLAKERLSTLTIGVLFIVLAIITAIGSVLQVARGKHPETTLPGVIISTISLSFMFYLWKAKLNVGRALNSATVIKDAACSFACIKLSVVLFLGSLLYAAAPSLWWADSIAALVLAYLIGREGWETVGTARQPDFKGGCGCADEHC